MILIDMVQSVNDFKDVATSDNFTLVGVLVALNMALAAALAYMYRSRERLQKDLIAEIKAMNETIIKMQNAYNDFVDNFKRLTNGR